MSEVSKIFHHVPKNRAITDRHHGLGDMVGIISQSQTETTAEQYYLHAKITPSPSQAAWRRMLGLRHGFVAARACRIYQIHPARAKFPASTSICSSGRTCDTHCIWTFIRRSLE